MSETATYKVRLEPVGVEMDVQEGETVLEAAFRQGIALMHGCKEGQCGSCKSRLLSGDIELLKYSTFALADYERETEHVLLCRTHAYSDLEVELLNFDEELLSRAIPVKEFAARVVSVKALTHDIRLLEIELDQPMRFWAGQYADLTLDGSGVTRAFSMANVPGDGTRMAFIIKKYPDGAFSSLLDGGLKPGAAMRARGPFGTCMRREGRGGAMVLVGGGSGMSPLWSILNDQARSGERRPVRFFYGARTRADLFMLDEIAAVGATIGDFEFIPALSHSETSDGWSGETGLIHEVLKKHLAANKPEGGADAYACGPPAMIDAVLPILHMSGVEPERIYFDKFTPAAR